MRKTEEVKIAKQRSSRIGCSSLPFTPRRVHVVYGSRRRAAHVPPSLWPLYTLGYLAFLLLLLLLFLLLLGSCHVHCGSLACFSTERIACPSESDLLVLFRPFRSLAVFLANEFDSHTQGVHFGREGSC